jgi:hypothetical protein
MQLPYLAIRSKHKLYKNIYAQTPIFFTDRLNLQQVLRSIITVSNNSILV